MLFSELKKKEVINLKNCQKLGRVSDFEFDECTGQIFKLIIPGENKWCGLFGSDSNYVICYKDIKQIGPDIIIVDIIIKVTYNDNSYCRDPDRYRGGHP